MLYGLWCTTVSVSSKYACVRSLLSLSPSPQGGDFTWQRWDHPAEDGEPCECPALLLRSLTLSNPVLHGMPTSLVHGQSCLAPGSHKSCHSRGSQGYCLPHLRFGLVLEEPGKLTLAVLKEAFTLITFSLCYEHIQCWARLPTYGAPVQSSLTVEGFDSICKCPIKML